MQPIYSDDGSKLKSTGELKKCDLIHVQPPEIVTDCQSSSQYFGLDQIHSQSCFNDPSLPQKIPLVTLAQKSNDATATNDYRSVLFTRPPRDTVTRKI